MATWRARGSRHGALANGRSRGLDADYARDREACRDKRDETKPKTTERTTGEKESKLCRNAERTTGSEGNLGGLGSTTGATRRRHRPERNE